MYVCLWVCVVMFVCICVRVRADIDEWALHQSNLLPRLYKTTTNHFRKHVFEEGLQCQMLSCVSVHKSERMGLFVLCVRATTCVRLAQLSYIASVESTVSERSDGLVSPDNSLQAPTILSPQLCWMQFTSVQLLPVEICIYITLLFDVWNKLQYLAYYSLQPLGARISHWTMFILLWQ